MKQQSMRESLCFWQSIRDEKLIVEALLKQRLDQLRHEFRSAMAEHEVSFHQIAQTFRERGSTDMRRFVVYVCNHIVSELEDIKIKFALS